jgi:hypothetical protein
MRASPQVWPGGLRTKPSELWPWLLRSDVNPTLIKPDAIPEQVGDPEAAHVSEDEGQKDHEIKRGNRVRG